MKIYKYIITPHFENIIKMPVGAEILSLQFQDPSAVIWAKVDTSSHVFEDRVFHIYATGENLQDTSEEYVGTFQIPSERLAFHVFEKKQS